MMLLLPVEEGASATGSLSRITVGGVDVPKPGGFSAISVCSAFGFAESSEFEIEDSFD